MGQTWTDDVFAGTHNAQTDLQNMENNFQTLKTMFSGISAPANAVEGMGWFDSDNFVMKQYNNAAWVGLMHGDALQKLWVYRNSAMAGWVVDASVSDRVLAFKGGTTYTTGGAAAGNWAVSGLTGGNHSHTYSGTTALSGTDTIAPVGSGAAITLNHSHTYSGTTASGGVGSAITSAGTWRPAASVGSLQMLAI